MVVSGLTYHWCSCHPDPEGGWNGLYVPYEETDHDAAVAKNKETFGIKRVAVTTKMTVAEAEVTTWLCPSVSRKFFVAALCSPMMTLIKSVRTV